MVEKGGKALMALKQRHEESWTRHGSGLDRFLRISFSRARFDGVAVFSGRSFEETADFTDARFYYPPDFDGAANAARIARSTAVLFSTGSAPGRPKQTGHVLEFGAAPKLVGHPQKIFVAVSS